MQISTLSKYATIITEKIILKPLIHKAFNLFPEPLLDCQAPVIRKTYPHKLRRVNTEWLNLVYESFARDAGISETQKALLIEDNAEWHRSQKCKIPEGLFIDFLPPYSLLITTRRKTLDIGG
jgi:hypothetical protein